MEEAEKEEEEEEEDGREETPGLEEPTVVLKHSLKQGKAHKSPERSRQSSPHPARSLLSVRSLLPPAIPPAFKPYKLRSLPPHPVTTGPRQALFLPAPPSERPMGPLSELKMGPVRVMDRGEGRRSDMTTSDVKNTQSLGSTPDRSPAIPLYHKSRT